MCDGIEYFLDGERVTVYFGEPGVELPVRTRSGAIAFYRWGALGKYYFSDDNPSEPKRRPRLRRKRAAGT